MTHQQIMKTDHIAFADDCKVIGHKLPDICHVSVGDTVPEG